MGYKKLIKAYDLNTGTPELDSDIINDIYEDSSEQLWLAGELGFYKYNRETDQFARIYYELEGAKGVFLNQYRKIIELSSNVLLLTTYGHEYRKRFRLY